MIWKVKCPVRGYCDKAQHRMHVSHFLFYILRILCLGTTLIRNRTWSSSPHTRQRYVSLWISPALDSNSPCIIRPAGLEHLFGGWWIPSCQSLILNSSRPIRQEWNLDLIELPPCLCLFLMRLCLHCTLNLQVDLIHLIFSIDWEFTVCLHCLRVWGHRALSHSLCERESGAKEGLKQFSGIPGGNWASQSTGQVSQC